MTEPVMDKTSKEILDGFARLQRLISESKPDGIDAGLAFFLLIQCECLCDKLRLILGNTPIYLDMGRPLESSENEW